MNNDMLKSIDDSALENVSGGHLGEIIAHVREHVAAAVDFAADAVGEGLQFAGKVLEKIGGKIAD